MISSAPARVFDMVAGPPLARATNDRPAMMFQPSDSYTCSTIPLEHRLHVSSQLGPGVPWPVCSGFDNGWGRPLRVTSGGNVRAPRIK